jgi:hypothetical protein
LWTALLDRAVGILWIPGWINRLRQFGADMSMIGAGPSMQQAFLQYHPFAGAGFPGDAGSGLWPEYCYLSLLYLLTGS